LKKIRTIGKLSLSLYIEINKKTEIMTNLVKGLSVVDFIQGRKGTFRAIVKVQAGFYSSVNCESINTLAGVVSRFKKGALQTVEFIPEGTTYPLTVFAKKGKNIILADEALLKEMTVGVINGLFPESNLCDQAQYKAVNAKTWADKAFVINS
jgi:hypothetical protein